VEAMQEEIGQLKLSTEIAEDRCKVMIQDNGTGINKEALSYIFTPFYSGKENGLGIDSVTLSACFNQTMQT
jgi:C4-dicarboxylate-specific signal transduction histidine kinase